MNTKSQQAKINWLATIGYTVTPLEDGSVIASHQDTTILLNDTTMEIRMDKKYFKLQGWKQLELQPFVAIAHAFDIIPPMTASEKAHSAHMMEHYGAAFYNQLS